MNRFKIHARRMSFDMFQRISLYAYLPQENSLLLAKPAEFTEERQPMSLIEPSPLLSLDPDQAQALMDDLWTCGVRPTEGAGSAGAMKATERHLEDLRKIVFSQLGIT